MYPFLPHPNQAWLEYLESFDDLEDLIPLLLDIVSILIVDEVISPLNAGIGELLEPGLIAPPPVVQPPFPSPPNADFNQSELMQGVGALVTDIIVGCGFVNDIVNSLTNYTGEATLPDVGLVIELPLDENGTMLVLEVNEIFLGGLLNVIRDLAFAPSGPQELLINLNLTGLELGLGTKTQLLLPELSPGQVSFLHLPSHLFLSFCIPCC